MTIEILQEFDREGRLDTPEAREISLKVYEGGLPSHPCYWNDRFYIAVRANLPKKHQKLAAHRSIVENGEEKYFEATTHHGFDMVGLLKDLGVPEKILESITPSQKLADYQELAYEIRRFIQEKFGSLNRNEASDLERELCGGK